MDLLAFFQINGRAGVALKSDCHPLRNIPGKRLSSENHNFVLITIVEHEKLKEFNTIEPQLWELHAKGDGRP